MGLTLKIPDGGIRKLTKGSETYLGIFGDFGVASPQLVPQIETNAQLVELTVHPEGMTLTTVQPELAADVLRVAFDSPADTGGAAVEYAWRIDQGTWSEWASDRDVTVQDPMLYMQAKHVLQVSARLVGRADIAGPDPRAGSLHDRRAPAERENRRDDRTASGFALSASDIVSPATALLVRTRGTDTKGNVAAWSEWMPLAQAQVTAGLMAIDVEVRDENGNVGKISTQLIRGGPDPTPPVERRMLVRLHGRIPVFERLAGDRSRARRARRALCASPVRASRTRDDGARARIARDRGRDEPGVLVRKQRWRRQRLSRNRGEGRWCRRHPPSGPTRRPPCPDGCAARSTACGSDCNQPCGPGLPQGLIGAYTSLAQAPDGTIWVSGYNDAAVDPGNGIDALYGDLVVGKYDPTKQSGSDGSLSTASPAPPTDGSCPDNNPNGWRGGLLDSGPDVGLWTSIVLDANNNPMVSYYDSTNQALKFASSTDGVTWTTHAVYANAGSDAGRYSKIVLS